MKIKSILIIFYMLGSLSAQSFLKQNSFKKISAFNDVFNKDTLRVLAVRAEFVEDNDILTGGNGLFGSIYSQNYSNSIIDPLPHDLTYFQNHLLFAQNYFKKVSKGKLNLKFEILNNIITVSKTMREYGPQRDSDDFTPLANLADEVWSSVVSADPNIDFSKYDLFIVFHAGVGNDVSLPGSLGNEKDLPSIYLSTKTLKNIYGQSFNGFVEKDGNHFVNNTIILPETESRELESFGQKILFEISINGLIVSNIASHLGLPDLFNTDTGESAIGRFGLMDGQSIFAFGGLFPPVPSAWERTYLGWETPITIDESLNKINISTSISALANDTTIIKVPINSHEYYLIENVNRDVFKNGSILTYKIGDNSFTKSFAKDTIGFNNISVDSLEGVVVDVDEFNWALPGSGILIWHIDEDIINDKITVNKINNDKLLRGVDLEEADGIQDIGERVTLITQEQIVLEGDEFDFWHSGNNSQLFKNEFSFNSQPNSKSNSGAASLISLNNFSEINSVMNFNLEIGNSQIKRNLRKKLSLIGTVRDLKVTSNYIYILDDSTLKIFSLDGNLIDSSIAFSDGNISVHTENSMDYVCGKKNNDLKVLYNDGINLLFKSVNLNSFISSIPSIRINNNKPEVMVGDSDGNAYTYNLVDSILTTFNSVTASDSVKFILTNEETVIYTSDYSLTYSTGESIDFQNKIIQAVLTENKNGFSTVVALTDNNEISIIEQKNIINQFALNIYQPVTNFILADINNSGENNIIIPTNDKIYAFNIRGAVLDKFPFDRNGVSDFSKKLISFDLDNDGIDDIVSISELGDLYIINSKSVKPFESFPLSIGGKLAASPTVQVINNKLNLLLIAANNYLFSWSLGENFGEIKWTSDFSDNLNSSYIPPASFISKVSEFFPVNKAYNWPNPVYGNNTNIRFYTADESNVIIKIVDLGGELVKEFNIHSTAGFENELSWDVTNIQSGVYFANLKATSVNGKNAGKIIKILVIK